MKKISILGVTGSIGLQTIDVVINHPDSFEIIGVAAGHRIDVLEKVLEQVQPKYVSVIRQEDAFFLQKKYPKIQFMFGDDALITIATLKEVDVVCNALVGFVGLIPTIEAIKARKTIALANKETLVVAGDLIKKYLEEYGVKLLPVDSEHSAIFQALNGENPKTINKLIITASGGSFRELSREELKHVTVESALKHPNWSMGAKITIDSATMFNKGFEVIEAHHLFNIPYDKIEVVIHEQSIVHSIVEFNDTSMIAQLGTADMRLPIQYALTYPDRMPLIGGEHLSLAKVGQLTFREMKFSRYPALEMAFQAGQLGGSAPVVLNAANEQAVALFLDHKIPFLDIETLVKQAIDAHPYSSELTIEEMVKMDRWAREFVIARGERQCQ